MGQGNKLYNPSRARCKIASEKTAWLGNPFGLLTTLFALMCRCMKIVKMQNQCTIYERNGQLVRKCQAGRHIRRFLTRGKANVRMELFFLAMAFNLKKLRMKRENNRLQTHLSEIQIAQRLKRQAFPQNGFCQAAGPDVPEIAEKMKVFHTLSRKYCFGAKRNLPQKFSFCGRLFLFSKNAQTRSRKRGSGQVAEQMTKNNQ